MRCVAEKICDPMIQEYMPRQVDREIYDFVYGLATWKVCANIIQIFGWPWVTVPARRSETVGSILYLWNLVHRLNTAYSWVLMPGRGYCIPMPLIWQETKELLQMGEEFGRFAQNLPDDVMTDEGFAKFKKTLPWRESREEPASCLPAIQKKLVLPLNY